MAGAGFKTFTTGEVLLAADVNTYLMQQTVMVFDDASARATALPTPSEGMFSYLKDTNLTYRYDGSAWLSDAGTTSPLTTKGDVWGYSTTDARIPVGADGTVLTADSAEALGVKWAAAAGGSTFSGASVYKSAAQSVANATSVASTFDTEAFDTDSYHSTATNTSRFTIPSGKDGKYLLLGRVTYVANTTGVRQARFLKNGNLIALNTDTSPGAGGGQNVEVSGIYSAVAGDYFEVAFWQNSGGSLNSENGGEYYDAFFIQYLGA